MRDDNSAGELSRCQIRFENGLPARVFYGGREIGSQWGSETADYDSFFTFDSGSRGCNIVADRKWSVEQSHHREIEVRMAEGHWRLIHSTKVQPHRIVRRQHLVCLEDSVFQDFVCRFRFHSSCFNTGRIAQIAISHENSNKWYQFPVTSARIEGRQARVEVRTVAWEGAGKLSLATYLRDQPNGEWIIHARLMPSADDQVWIHWRTRFGTLLDLRGRTASNVLRIQPLKTALWYLHERRGGRPQLAAQALALLPKGSEISIEAECLIVG